MKEVISHEPNLREISKKNRRFVLLDTNFILACVKQKIDFFEEIKFMGIKILIPEQVINELKKIVNSKKKLHSRNNAEIALKILEKKKNSFRRIDLLNYGKNTDKRIKNFADKNEEVIVATLDRELKSKIKNQKLTIREKKKLEII